MILVNVTRSWLATNTPEKKIETVERAWPTRNAVEVARMFEQEGDLLVAVARGKIMSVRTIESVSTDEDEPSRFVFMTKPFEAAAPLIGVRSPVVWGRGEQWPVKFGEKGELLSMLEPMPSATLGKFTATLTADGDLRVACPKGRAVIVTTM